MRECKKLERRKAGAQKMGVPKSGIEKKWDHWPLIAKIRNRKIYQKTESQNIREQESRSAKNVAQKFD